MNLDPFKNYPSLWSTFDQHAGRIAPQAIGFACKTGDIRRFGARYRAAKAFRDVRFDGMVADTADGYSELCHLLLTYSALEHLIECIGGGGTGRLLKIDERDKALAHLRDLDGHRAMFRFVRPHVQTKHAGGELDKYIAGQACDPLQLAKGIRHVFAHGILSATPQGVPSRTVGTVSRYLCKVMLFVMDREFTDRVEALRHPR